MDKYIQEDNKVDIAETIVNGVFVKEELCDFQESQELGEIKVEKPECFAEQTVGNAKNNSFNLLDHKVKTEVENTTDTLGLDEQTVKIPNSINALKHEIKVEEATVSLESVEKENVEVVYVEESSDMSVISDAEFFCNECGADYNGFCPDCSTLSHFLNNNVPPSDSDWKIKTIPKDILEIRQFFDKNGVFALRNLPKNVIFGPFNGISGIESINGYMWKIKNNKLLNVETGNWMQYVACASNEQLNNLEVFQFNGDLYFQTKRNISENEELLLYYSEKNIQTLKSDDEIISSLFVHFNYYVPELAEIYQGIFACGLCCLGFTQENSLIEHKTKCPYSKHDDVEIIKCERCSVWMEKREHTEHHIKYCGDSREYGSVMSIDQGNASKSVKVEELVKNLIILNDFSPTDKMGVQKQFRGYPQRTCSTKSESVSTVCLDKPYHCGICKKNFIRHSYLRKHIKRLHKTEISKNFKCSQCTYETIHEGKLKFHVQSKHGIEEKYMCSQCTYETNHRIHFRQHIRRKHIKPKDFKCSECDYATNRKCLLNQHFKCKHEIGVTKQCKCTQCSYQTHFKGNLIEHIRAKHSLGKPKDYKCSECDYETNSKGNFKAHFNNKHSSGIPKKYKCPHCTYETNHNFNLKNHIKTKHNNEKTYKCEQCSYQTNNKRKLKQHIKESHIDSNEEQIDKNEKDYQCSECDYKTNYKKSLLGHIKDKHRTGIGKDHKCSECDYETNHKCDLNKHMKNVHPTSDVKDFKCPYCPHTSNHKCYLRRHIENKHPDKDANYFYKIVIKKDEKLPKMSDSDLLD